MFPIVMAMLALLDNLTLPTPVPILADFTSEIRDNAVFFTLEASCLHIWSLNNGP